MKWRKNMKVIKMLKYSPVTGAKYALVEMPFREIVNSNAYFKAQNIRNAQVKKCRANNTRKK